MSHPNARLTLHGRRLLIERVRSGRPVAHVAGEMGISRATAYKWVRRWRTEGDAGLFDRPSRPRTTPHRTASDAEAQVCTLRRERRLGPARIGPILGIPASTVHRVLTRHGLNRLRWMDRPTGQVIRRYERARPGELIHVDIKKLGNIPDGGGHGLSMRMLERIGGWPEQFFFAHEETDLAWRALDDGWRVVYEPSLLLQHPWTSPARHAVYYRMTARNRVWLAKRHLPAPLVPVYLGVWAALTVVRTRSWDGWRAWAGGFAEGVRESGGQRRPMRWATVARMTRLGRPPII